jgi:hypothetical protein
VKVGELAVFDSVVEYFALECKAREWERWHRIDRRVLAGACTAGLLNFGALLVCRLWGLSLRYPGLLGWGVAALMTLSVYTSWRARRAELALRAGYKVLFQMREQQKGRP